MNTKFIARGVVVTTQDLVDMSKLLSEAIGACPYKDKELTAELRALRQRLLSAAVAEIRTVFT